MPEIQFPDPPPRSYGELQDFVSKAGKVTPFSIRRETFQRIEQKTQRPLLCYATKIWKVPQGTSVFIDDEDLIGFGDLIDSVEGDKADIFVTSNGGSAEATERIVRRLRSRFKCLRFIVPSNAYSAATLMCFSGDQILMLPEGTLGPIDPQINGVPGRAILRAFETLEKRLAEEGAKALTAYVPLLQKYDLHLLEQCRSAQQLSEELARSWLTQYAMQKSDEKQIDDAVQFFANWDLHKSHGRSIDAAMSQKIGIPAQILDGHLADLVRSLFHQYVVFFNKTPFYKLFENSAGINWGHQRITPTIGIPMGNPGILPPTPDPGKPGKSEVA